ncbi:23172_t:CDS:1, partial [Gigaspora rosea]
ENQLKDADRIVKQQIQYINDNTYAGSYIRTIDNNVVFYTTYATAVNTILNLPAVIPIMDLLRFDVRAQNNFNLAGLKARRDRVYELALEHNPVFVTIFLDIELNNVVVSLYHEYDDENRPFTDDVNQQFNNPPIVFEYKDLPDNEQLNANVSAIKRRDLQITMLAGDGFCNLDQSLTCSLGYFGIRQTAAGAQERVFVTSGRCYRYEIDYHLKPWSPLGVQPPHIYHIGRMDSSSIRHSVIDYGVLRIEEGENRPTPFIKNLDSPSHPMLQIWNRNLNRDIHVGIHLCKSGYHTRVTCGYQRSLQAFFTDQTDPYIIAHVINIENNWQDVGGPVFQFRTLSTVNLVGILTGGIGNIGLTTDLNEITRSSGVTLVRVN